MRWTSSGRFLPSFFIGDENSLSLLLGIILAWGYSFGELFRIFSWGVVQDIINGEIWYVFEGMLFLAAISKIVIKYFN